MRLIGTVILTVGIVLFIFGVNSTQVLREKTNKEVTGRYTDNTMWYLVGGIALTIAGAAITRMRPRD